MISVINQPNVLRFDCFSRRSTKCKWLAHFLRAQIVGASRISVPLCALFFVLVGGVIQLQAQFPGGGFGGFPGGGGATSRSRTTTRPYANNGVGDAVISIDPETRNL